MKHKGLRITIGVMTGFIAITAIGGGIALLTGAEGGRFPLAWLEGTPFKDYTIPALLLAVVVGGSSLSASGLVFLRRKTDLVVSLAAGIIMTGYIVVEILILKQVPPDPTVMELIYLALGLIIFILATTLWWVERR